MEQHRGKYGRINMDLHLYKNKKVLVTGHTGFKGSWLCRMLTNAGAEVIGYSLKPPTNPNLFDIADLNNRLTSIEGDIRDYEHLYSVFSANEPEIVFHLAAQPIVRESYKEPRYTYETNVMGTVNLLECVRRTASVKSVVNVTTDKVYKNNEWYWGYREDEPLDGYDPYSNSKSCSELVTHSYINSFFFGDNAPAISTARAGNVIGGGDFAKDRIIPDCIRAIEKKETIIVRNPSSTRPYQHVLEPLYVYLLIAQKQYENKKYAGFYNVGPDDVDCLSTGALVELFCKTWGREAQWKNVTDPDSPHEASFLKLDCSKIKRVFNWKPRWNINECMDMVCRFSKVWLDGGDVGKEMDLEIGEFLSCNK